MTDELESGEAYWTRTLEAEGHAELIRKLWALVDRWHEARGRKIIDYYTFADELEELLPSR